MEKKKPNHRHLLCLVTPFYTQDKVLLIFVGNIVIGGSCSNLLITMYSVFEEWHLSLEDIFWTFSLRENCSSTNTEENLSTERNRKFVIRKVWGSDVCYWGSRFPMTLTSLQMLHDLFNFWKRDTIPGGSRKVQFTALKHTSLCFHKLTIHAEHA